MITTAPPARDAGTLQDDATPSGRLDYGHPVSLAPAE